VEKEFAKVIRSNFKLLLSFVPDNSCQSQFQCFPTIEFVGYYHIECGGRRCFTFGLVCARWRPLQWRWCILNASIGRPNMQTPPEVFFHLTATGWSAVGSIVGAASIIALAVFNVLTLRAAFRATRAAESQSSTAQASLGLLREQLALTQRPFIAINSEYCADIDAYLVYAHNQGNGPALDVEVSLTFDEVPIRNGDYLIGCMPVDGNFQFRIGDTSKRLSAATIWYRSITAEDWTTKVTLLAGYPALTMVTRGDRDKDAEHHRIRNMLARATQTEE
jgi:hypothetical protein